MPDQIPGFTPAAATPSSIPGFTPADATVVQGAQASTQPTPPSTLSSIGTGFVAGAKDLGQGVLQAATNPAMGGIPGVTDIPVAYRAYEAARSSGGSMMDAAKAAGTAVVQQQNMLKGLEQRVEEFKANPVSGTARAITDLLPMIVGGVLKGASALGVGAEAEGAGAVKSVATAEAPGLMADVRSALGKGVDTQVVKDAAARLPKAPAAFSDTTNELKLLKPQADTDLKTANLRLDQTLKARPALVTDAASRLGQVFDSALDKIKSGVSDSAETEAAAVQKVRNAVVSKLTDDETPASAINDLKRKVGDQLKTFNPPEMLDSAAKQASEAYRQAYFELRNMVSEAVPESKTLNNQISRLINLQEALEKKFPDIQTPADAKASYDAVRGQNMKEIGAQSMPKVIRENFPGGASIKEILQAKARGGTIRGTKP